MGCLINSEKLEIKNQGEEIIVYQEKLVRLQNQVALKENAESKNYYLTAEDNLPYQKIEKFKSIFDGRNCKLPENNNKND